jgi:2'-5' RNA ligase
MLTLFNDRPCEYSWLIKPGDIVSQKTMCFKEVLQDSIGLSVFNRKSLPHISLVKKEYDYELDDFIRDKTINALKGIKSFKIVMGGAEVFKHGDVSRTLVLKVNDPEPIQKINKKIRAEFNFKQKKLLPHVTIARSIPLSDFNKLPTSLNEFDCRDEFICNKITILKKFTEESKGYDLFYEVQLN